MDDYLDPIGEILNVKEATVDAEPSEADNVTIRDAVSPIYSASHYEMKLNDTLMGVIETYDEEGSKWDEFEDELTSALLSAGCKNIYVDFYEKHIEFSVIAGKGNYDNAKRAIVDWFENLGGQKMIRDCGDAWGTF